MLPELEPILQRYQLRKATLYKDVSDLNITALDWKAAPKCTTIGTLLLHIAGIEDLKISSMKGFDIHQRWQESDWSKLRPGFAIELKREGPQGHEVGYYINILQELEAKTIQYFQNLDRGTLMESSPFYIEGKDFQPGCFEILQNHALLMSILQHEQYHRGQITLLKFLFFHQT